MKYTLCFLLLFTAVGSYCQESFKDYVESGNMYNYLTIPVTLDHHAYHDRLAVDSTFKAQIKRIHEYADYYIERAQQVDVREIVIKIMDAKYNYMTRMRGVGVCDLERELERNRKEKFTRDTSANVTIVNGVIDVTRVSLYKVFHALADFYKLKLDLKGPIEQYGMPIDFTIHLNGRQINDALCIIHTGSGFCSTLVDNKLIVQRNFGGCTLNCKE